MKLTTVPLDSRTVCSGWDSVDFQGGLVARPWAYYLNVPEASGMINSRMTIDSDSSDDSSESSSESGDQNEALAR